MSQKHSLTQMPQSVPWALTSDMTHCLPVAEEGPDDAPTQVGREDVAEPDVGGFQKNLAVVRDAQLLTVKDGCSKDGQTKNTHNIELVEPARRAVPHHVGF